MVVHVGRIEAKTLGRSQVLSWEDNDSSKMFDPGGCEANYQRARVKRVRVRFAIDEYEVLRCPHSEVILLLYQHILSAADTLIVYSDHLTISVLPPASSSRFLMFKMATPMTIVGFNVHMVVDVEHTKKRSS